MEPLQSALSAIARRDADIKAWAHLSANSESVAPRGQRRPLEGLLFGVKDIIDVEGMPTGCGASLRQTPPCRFDASCVAQLRAAGAVPIGKTVTAEYAYTVPGPTRNPWNLEYTPGGSSSGSAAAVAAGMVPMALGTQTGGSMIRPAAFNGVVGFKPSFGYVHRAGMTILCDTLDTIGWFTRDVDLAHGIAKLFLPEAPQSLPPTSNLRIAVLPCRSVAPLSPEAQRMLDDVAATLGQHCARVDWLHPDEDADILQALHAGIMRYELARGLLPVWRSEPQALRAGTIEGIEEGLRIGPTEYGNMQLKRAEIEGRWRQRFADYDLAVTPSAPGEAPKGLTTTGSSVFNRIWSLLGWPCLHLPCAMSSKGLPMGVQWVGKPGQDTALLSLAERLHSLIDQRAGKPESWPEPRLEA
jgi:Asp-tRNA(Asn)/Glu-tRNA(Gln) amidotransferase A subunit family amidase